MAHVCTYRFALVRRFLLGFYALSALCILTLAAQSIAECTAALAWDIIILVLTMTGMRRQKLPPHSTLWSALFQQGFGYLLITCLTCIPMIILIALDLNGTSYKFIGDSGTDDVGEQMR